MEPSFLGKISLSTHHQPPAPLPPKKKHRFLPIAVAGAIILLAIIGCLLLVQHHTSNGVASNATPSLTLYYNDGKTVMWHRGPNSLSKAEAPYFTAMVEAQLEKSYGQNYLNKGSWSVTTTLDPKLQATAEKLVADNAATMQSSTKGVIDESALVLQDVKTGQIKALVGGEDFDTPDYGRTNYANTRLPGSSSMIPFSYAALINGTTNTGAGTPMDDTQGPLPGYPCTNTSLPFKGQGGNCAENYDYKFAGTLPLRYALGGKRNVPAIKAMVSAVPNDTSQTKINSIRKTLKLIDDSSVANAYQCYSDEALTKPTQCYTAAAIGDGAYITLLNQLHGLATIANDGKKTSQTTIAAVSLNGKPQTVPGQSKTTQVIKPDTAYILNNILSDPNASYLPGSCDASSCTSLASSGYKFEHFQGWDFAVDPGTTGNGYSATMASWSTQYAAISWVGNHAQDKAIPTSGELLTEPLTRGLMEAAHTGLTPTNWQQPGDIQVLPAFVLTKHIDYGDVEPSPATDIYPSWYSQH